jgi:8-oxo-dGTP diphosphatase
MNSTANSKTIAIAVVLKDDRYLVGKRPEGVALAGFWEFPGGKVEAHDGSPDIAACRECLEETGLAIAIQSELAHVRHEYAHGTLELHFFLAHPLDASTEPHGAFRWVSREELLRLDFPPANQTVLEQIRAARY